MVLDPSNSTDIASDAWLHWRVVNEFQADLVHHRVDDSIDIRVKRKIEAGEDIIWTFNSTVNYHIALNVRALLLIA
jgi:hypothetical protein